MMLNRIALILAAVAAPAFAQATTQPAAEEAQYDDDAIVVIGITKQDANIQDTPI